eukprot:jgi/Ulvmu1/11140/UM071_0024.1
MRVVVTKYPIPLLPLHMILSTVAHSGTSLQLPLQLCPAMHGPSRWGSGVTPDSQCASTSQHAACHAHVTPPRTCSLPPPQSNVRPPAAFSAPNRHYHRAFTATQGGRGSGFLSLHTPSTPAKECLASSSAPDAPQNPSAAGLRA